MVYVRMVLFYADSDLSTGESHYRDCNVEILPTDIDNKTELSMSDLDEPCTTDMHSCVQLPLADSCGEHDSGLLVSNTENGFTGNSLCQNVEGRRTDQRFLCDICHKSFTHSYMKEAHRLTHTTGCNFTCTYCGKRYVYLLAFKRHMSMCRSWPQKLFSCALCNRQFMRRGFRDRHQVAHGTRQTYCYPRTYASVAWHNIRKQYFASYFSVQRHMETRANQFPSVHIDDVTSCVCSVCKTPLSSSADLQKHMETHVNQCPSVPADVVTSSVGNVYKASFSSSSDPQKHMEMMETLPNTSQHKHDVAGHIVCNACKQRFDSFSSFQQHKKIHLPFPCEFCGKEFTRKLYLTKHLHLHRDNRPFRCKICHQTFTRADKLRSHSLKHVFKPTYSSAVSSKIEQSSTLNDFVDEVVENSHICEICYRTFKDERMFETHMRLHSRLQTFYQRK